MIRKTSGLVCILLLCACSDQLQVNKAISINDPFEITPNFKLLNFFPSTVNGAIPVVSVNLPEIRLQFADSLNSTTINAKTVYLQAVSTASEMQAEEKPPLTSPLEYNYANGMLSIVVKHLLTPSTEYHLLINGVTNTRGDKLIGHVVPFRTRANPATSVIEYTNETPKRRFVFKTDNAGRKTELLVYNTYDTIETQDDFIVSKTEYNKTLGERLANEITYDASGNILYYEADIWEGNVIAAHGLFDKPGRNQKWGDDDDLISRYTDSTHLREHYRLNRFYVANSDSNSAPLWQNKTSAFKFDHAVFSIYDRFNKLLQTIVYSSLGQYDEIDANALGEPTPLDDEIQSYTLYQYDNNGNELDGIGLLATSSTFAAPPSKTGVDLKGAHGRDTLVAYQTFNKDPATPIRINQSIDYVKTSRGYDAKEITLHEYAISPEPSEKYIKKNTQVFRGDTVVKEITYDTEK